MIPTLRQDSFAATELFVVTRSSCNTHHLVARTAHAKTIELEISCKFQVAKRNLHETRDHRCVSATKWSFMAIFITDLFHGLLRLLPLKEDIFETWIMGLRNYHSTWARNEIYVRLYSCVISLGLLHAEPENRSLRLNFWALQQQHFSSFKSLVAEEFELTGSPACSTM